MVILCGSCSKVFETDEQCQEHQSIMHTMKYVDIIYPFISSCNLTNKPGNVYTWRIHSRNSLYYSWQELLCLKEKIRPVIRLIPITNYVSLRIAGEKLNSYSFEQNKATLETKFVYYNNSLQVTNKLIKLIKKC